MTDIRLSFGADPIPLPRSLAVSGAVGGLVQGYGTNFSPTNSAHYATNQKSCSVIIDFPSSKTITNVQIYCQYKTASAPPTYKISLQSVDANGLPTGTILGGGTPASKNFAGASLTVGAWNTITLDNSYAVSAGDDFAIVLEYVSGTIGFSNYITVGDGWFGLSLNDVFTLRSFDPQYFSPSWSRDTSGDTYTSQFRVGDGTDTWRLEMIDNYTSDIFFNTTDNPDEYGIKFQVAQPWKVYSACALVNGNAYSGPVTLDFDLTIYDDSDNVVTSQNWTYIPSGASFFMDGVCPFPFDTPAVLLPDRTYRYAVKSNDATDLLVHKTTFISSAALATVFPMNYPVIATNRNNGGAWTDDDTSTYDLALIGVPLSSIAARGRHVRVPRRGTNDKRGIIRRG